MEPEKPKENKKEILREKALAHYYNNIPYYREYYCRNKEKLLKYNKDYKNKIKNITFEKHFKKADVKIEKGNFTVYFD